MAFVYLVTFLAVMVLVIIGGLRMIKGVLPLRSRENAPLPGFPGAVGLIHRLDGADQRQRTMVQGRRARVDAEGKIYVPKRWADSMTAGRLACVAYLWALSSIVKEDLAAANVRRMAVYRATMIPLLSALVLVACIGVGMIGIKLALCLMVCCWAFFTFAAIPSQFREWKAVESAKKGLKEAGMWPQLASDAEAVSACLKAMTWCHVAGFRSIQPK